MIDKTLKDSYERALKHIKTYPYSLLIFGLYCFLSMVFYNVFEFFSGYVFGIAVLMIVLSTQKYFKAKSWLIANT